MPFEVIIQKYGYLAVFLGAFFEGESPLVAGGFAAQRGYLHLSWVIALAFLGSVAWDQIYFFAGRRKGKAILAKRPAWQPNVARVNRFLDRHQIWLIMGFRFVYGLRTITPLLLGMSSVKTSRFIILNIISGIIWAMVVGVAGYLFGSAVEAVVGDIRRHEKFILIAILALGLLLWGFHRWRRRKTRTALPAESSAL
jgi:membrane protein DedA with SNARE-associated domain